MTKVLERPTEVRTHLEELPRSLEPQRPQPEPRRPMRWFMWLLTFVVVAALGVVWINSVYDDPAVSPPVYERLREPYHYQAPAAEIVEPTDVSPPYMSSFMVWNEYLEMQAAAKEIKQLPYASSIAVWNEFLEKQAIAEATNKPYDASVASWNEFLQKQAEAEEIKQLPYASSLMAWNEFLDFES